MHIDQQVKHANDIIISHFKGRPVFIFRSTSLLTGTRCNMPAPLCMVGEAFVALGAKVPWNLVVLSLMTFKQSFIRCFVSAQVTIPQYSFMYQHMFCEFVRA